MRKYKLLLFILLQVAILPCKALNTDNEKNKRQAFYPGDKWSDNNGNAINAHGGGILYHSGKYYWFGEHKSEETSAALVGITCYSSKDLYNWKYERVALSVSQDTTSEIVKGCTMERPKVIYNQSTKKFVMYFHLELKGQGYNAARVGIATSEKITGPYTFLKSCRPNAGQWPLNMDHQQQNDTTTLKSFKDWWTKDWFAATNNGMFVHRNFKGGQMSRDMTLFVDDNGKAYHIYSSEENLTLHIAELNSEYTGYTGKYIRIAPGGHNEAPTLLKKDGKYFMITSGCTGWSPNAARLFSADSILGTWTQHPNPCVGEQAQLTFRSQSTFVVPVEGRNDAFIFMADRWTPKRPINATYIWLPVIFEKGLPVLKWMDKWDLSVFDELQPTEKEPEERKGYTLIWNDEFNNAGKPDTAWWNYENGFVRNEEQQWYQPENAFCKNGTLNIVAKKEQIKNQQFQKTSLDWRKNRQYAEYSSSCIFTSGKMEFQYGNVEIRAKIPTASGSWPAIWTMGNSMPWPSNGEIDIMEFYRINDTANILANTAWGTDLPYKAKWNSSTVLFSDFTTKDPLWENKFHVWRMEWDENAIKIYLDDQKINETLLNGTTNGIIGEQKNPFKQPHYILLNLAIGGQHGGEPDDLAFPLSYNVDYVRIYQKTK